MQPHASTHRGSATNRCIAYHWNPEHTRSRTHSFITFITNTSSIQTIALCVVVTRPRCTSTLHSSTHAPLMQALCPHSSQRPSVCAVGERAPSYSGLGAGLCTDAGSAAASSCCWLPQSRCPPSPLDSDSDSIPSCYMPCSCTTLSKQRSSTCHHEDASQSTHTHPCNTTWSTQGLHLGNSTAMMWRACASKQSHGLRDPQLVSSMP
jgi:hypothetical protein